MTLGQCIKVGGNSCEDVSCRYGQIVIINESKNEVLHIDIYDNVKRWYTHEERSKRINVCAIVTTIISFITTHQTLFSKLQGW